MRPQFIISFNATQEDTNNFVALCGWLIQQTELVGWNFHSCWWSDRTSKSAIVSALTIEDTNLALLAKLTYPDILLAYEDHEEFLSEYFFYDRTKFSKVNSKNYDIIPKNI